MTTQHDKAKRRVVWIAAVLVANAAVFYLLRGAPPAKILIAAIATSPMLRVVFRMALQMIDNE
jgi:hypothetical protein